MIKNILFDFDGVILDSMKIKGDGFVELFQHLDNNGDNLKLLEKYHYENGGISRFEKIKYFYNDLLKKDISQNEIDSYAKKFSEIIRKKLYDKSNLIEDSVNYISKNFQDFRFHIVSGAENDELNDLCHVFDLTKYFLTIAGSPVKKAVLVKNIIEKNHYSIEETILIGDSINDYDAAKANNIKFYGYNNVLLKKYDYIDSFSSVSF